MNMLHVLARLTDSCFQCTLATTCPEVTQQGVAVPGVAPIYVRTKIHVGGDVAQAWGMVRAWRLLARSCRSNPGHHMQDTDVLLAPKGIGSMQQ